MIPVKNLRDAYKYYLENTEKPIKDRNGKTYQKIIQGFIKLQMSLVIDQSNDIEVGSANTLGTFSVRGKKYTPRLVKIVDPITGEEREEVRNVMVSWTKTKALWDSNPEAKANRTRVWCLNEHTDGVRYHFVWYQNDMKTINKTLYTFSITRGKGSNARNLHHNIMDGREYQRAAREEFA